jgi:D-glycero-alpha-D-manno-heptose-7-phosphate kinase
VLIESSAPTRIDLAGGTVDIWPLYLFHHDAQTINCAISLRARCRLTPRADSRIVIRFEAEGLELTTSSDSPVGAGIAGSSALNVAVCGALARHRQLDLSDAALLQIAMNVEAQAIDVPTGVQDYPNCAWTVCDASR